MGGMFLLSWHTGGYCCPIHRSSPSHARRSLAIGAAEASTSAHRIAGSMHRFRRSFLLQAVWASRQPAAIVAGGGM